MFDALFNSLAWLLDFFYTNVGHSYGLSIALLTFSVMLLCFPLTAKGTRGMAAMAKLQPELKRIQAKYKDDRVKQQEETMALFKEHKVTPLGGCLPMLVQAPVFFVMYRVLIGLTHKGAGGGFDPKYLSPGSTLYQALKGSRTMMSFGIDLAETASNAAKNSFGGSIPYFVMIAGVVATGYYQQRQISRRNPQGAGGDNPYAQSMQRMTKIFPLMYLVFGFTLPAGILVYFLVSNLFRIGQQGLIYKMDPSLLPGSGAPVVDASSKIVDPKANGTKPGKSAARPGRPRGPGSKDEGRPPATGGKGAKGASAPTGKKPQPPKNGRTTPGNGQAGPGRRQQPKKTRRGR